MTRILQTNRIDVFYCPLQGQQQAAVKVHKSQVPGPEDHPLSGAEVFRTNTHLMDRVLAKGSSPLLLWMCVAWVNVCVLNRLIA